MCAGWRRSALVRRWRADIRSDIVPNELVSVAPLSGAPSCVYGAQKEEGFKLTAKRKIRVLFDAETIAKPEAPYKPRPILGHV